MNNNDLGLILVAFTMLLGVTLKYNAYNKLKESDKESEEDSNKNERER